MAKMETKEVFNRYYETIPKSTEERGRAQVDRAELYEYEKTLGKSIFDMDVDELFGLLVTFRSIRTGELLTKQTYMLISTVYRALWNYYIDNVEVIKNPWNDKRMRGSALIDGIMKQLPQKQETITYATIEDIIRKIYNDATIGEHTAKYAECLIMLIYDGFATTKEIVELQESDIDFDNKEVHFPHKVVKLQDKTLDLLKWVHNLGVIDTPKGMMVAKPYKGGYFKLIIRASREYDVDSRDKADFARALSHKMLDVIRYKQISNISQRNIYLLGFYDFLVEQLGNESVQEIITSKKNQEDNMELAKYAKEYGVIEKRMSVLKDALTIFG